MDWLKYFEKELNRWNTADRIAAIEAQMECLDLNGKRVLDLACRYGVFVYLSLSQGASFVTGIDMKKGHVDKAKQYLKASGQENYSVHCGDVFKEDFVKPDVILCLGLLYHTQRQLELLSMIRKLNCPVLLETMVTKSTHRVVVWYQLDGESSQPFVPSKPMCEAMFERAGFEYSPPVMSKNHRRAIYHLQPSTPSYNDVDESQICPRSSAEQSACLRNRKSQVRILPGMLL